ncbi:MAG TPA: hypothetical protein VMO26_06875 [Vicinamibacterales bacterium]|nr:hypothetical protein [Vicinamibacterales bacterium]
MDALDLRLNGAGALNVAPFGVPVDAATARILFFSIHLVAAALANYSLESAKRLVAPLKQHSEITEVLRDYPSIAASPWPGVRLAVPVLSLILLLWSVLFSRASSSEMAWSTGWMIILLVSVHVPLMMLLWRPPIGSVTLSPSSRPGSETAR